MMVPAALSIPANRGSTLLAHSGGVRSRGEILPSVDAKLGIVGIATLSFDGGAWVVADFPKNIQRIEVVFPTVGNSIVHYRIGGLIDSMSWVEINEKVANWNATEKRHSAEGYARVARGHSIVSGAGWKADLTLPQCVCLRWLVTSATPGMGSYSVVVDRLTPAVDSLELDGRGLDPDSAHQWVGVRGQKLRFLARTATNDDLTISIDMPRVDRIFVIDVSSGDVD